MLRLGRRLKRKLIKYNFCITTSEKWYFKTNLRHFMLNKSCLEIMIFHDVEMKPVLFKVWYSNEHDEKELVFKCHYEAQLIQFLEDYYKENEIEL